MLPIIKFLRLSGEDTASGLSVTRQSSTQPQIFLPFNGVRKGPWTTTTLHSALALDANLIVAATSYCELALIDLNADRIIARNQIRENWAYNSHTLKRLNASGDGRYLFIEESDALTVIDAGTLDIVRQWQMIELTPSMPYAYTPSDGTTLKRHIQEGRDFDRLRLASPFKELNDGLLVAGFDKDAFYPKHRVKYYEFDIATGALTLQTVGAMPPDNSVARTAMAPSSVNNLETLPAFDELAGRESAIMIDAPLPDITGAIAAIEALAARIESEFDASMFTEEMIPRIAPGDGFMMDEDFFNQLVIHRCVEAVPALRRLLMAYLSCIEGGEGSMPWYNGYALRALVLLDVDADDVYRLHLIKGDLEHDQWPYNTLYPEYLRERGWRHEADLRFSTFLTLAGLQNTDVTDYELLAKAEEMVEPGQFCNIVLEECKDHEHVIDYFIETLPRANKFEEAVANQLRALRGV